MERSDESKKTKLQWTTDRVVTKIAFIVQLNSPLEKERPPKTEIRISVQKSIPVEEPD